MSAKPVQPVEVVLAHVASLKDQAEPGGLTMRAFNQSRDLDMPTAQAVQMRLSALGDRQVSWAEIVDVSSRDERDRLMWLSALSREEARDDLTDEIVIHAMQRAAAVLGQRSLGMAEYEKACGQLLSKSADWERVSWMFTTVNQILSH